MQTETELKITSRTLDSNDLAMLTLDGYINSTTAVQLKKEIEHLGKKIFRFIISFRGVEYVSSAGWGVVLTRIREFREKKGDIVFINMSDEVNSIFKLLELNQVIKYFSTTKDALRYFGVTEPGAVSELEEPLSGGDGSPDAQRLTIEDAIRRIVRENPLLNATQIKQTLTSPAYGFVKLNTLKVYFVLRRLRLNTRERKLYYAWQCLVKKTRM
ncbi:MAG: STAS domain-containing protein [candidate division WOR-3 bacterium]|nr:MAG: STAS domain-containing protein [candidate division WOR-3 bacterium]